MAVIHIFVFLISYKDVPVTISIMSDIYGNRNFLYLIVRRCSNKKVCFSIVAARAISCRIDACDIITL